jgi:hypothetical protein
MHTAKLREPLSKMSLYIWRYLLCARIERGVLSLNEALALNCLDDCALATAGETRSCRPTRQQLLVRRKAAAPNPQPPAHPSAQRVDDFGVLLI